MRRVVFGGLTAAVVALMLARVVPSAQSMEELMLPPRERERLPVCGTLADGAIGERIRARAAIPQGHPVFFRQEPAILTADYQGDVTFQDFLVVGDVETIRFKLATASSEIETWSRAETRTVAGRFVSVFRPSWRWTALAEVLKGNRWGWDEPGLYWGQVLPGDAVLGTGYNISLRIAPHSLPTVRVAQLANDLQYSSHVVNIVLPGFGDRLFTDDNGYELEQVTRRFYQDFEDSYDSLAVVPERIVTAANYVAFRQRVQNEVRGIGLDLFDFSDFYGSRLHRLHGVELYTQHFFATNGSSSHEMAHQWASFIDWTRLSGLVRAGSMPQSHDPLWGPGETLIGSALQPTRRARSSSDGWQIEQTPAPARFHPFTLYAMGLLSKEQVPEVTLFDDQGQFHPMWATTPEVGRPVTGATRSATVYNVIGMLGERIGPVPSELQRATIVVSREGLLSQREMDYWTFFAQRLEDPNRSGVVDYDGVGSFDLATDRRVDLKTGIRPLTAPRIEGPLEVDYPSFSERDMRDVLFDAPVASRYRAGDRLRFSGRVNAPDRSDISAITIRLWKSGGTTSDAIRLQAPVSSASSFIAETSIDASQRGTYLMEVFLFWPGSGVQFSRSAVSPIVIE